jgi:hypothetical protein
MSNKLVTHQATSITALRDQYSGKSCHLLLPKTSLDAAPVGTLLAVQEVTIDINTETYLLKGGGGKVALNKQALNKISSAAGITWVSVKRIDDRRQLDYYEYEARAQVMDFGGTVRAAIGTKELDLRMDADGLGTPGRATEGMTTDSQIKAARVYAPEMCATKAMNRAIATLLAIPRSYTKADLSLPFIVPRLVPDPSNPGTQRVMLAAMYGALDMLFADTGPSRSAPVQLSTPAPEQLAAPVRVVAEMTLDQKKNHLKKAYKHMITAGSTKDDWQNLVKQMGIPPLAEDMSDSQVAAIVQAVAARRCV